MNRVKVVVFEYKLTDYSVLLVVSLKLLGKLVVSLGVWIR